LKTRRQVPLRLPDACRMQRSSPRGLLHGLGNVARHIPGPFVRRCSTIRKGGWFSSRMVHSSDGGDGPPHAQLHGAAIQLAEDARADAADEKYPELLQVGIAVQDPGQHLLWGDEDANDGDQGDGGQEFDFHELKWEGFEDIWGWGGRKKRKLSCFLMAGQ